MKEVVNPIVNALPMGEQKYKFHPLADLFPLLKAPEFLALTKDIKANGLHEPIMLHEGMILDGRNRYRACLNANIAPKAVQFRDIPPPTISPVDYVVSRNLHRRHLTTQQRAAIAAELATMRSGERTDLASKDARSVMSNAQAAEALKVSEPSVERAKKRMREDPEAHEKAKAGTLPRKQPVPRVITAVRKRQEKEKAAFDLDGVSKHFTSKWQIEAFKTFCSAPSVQPFLSVEQQAPLAEAIRMESEERDVELTGSFIRHTAWMKVDPFQLEERRAAREEQERLEQQSPQAKLDRRVNQLCHHLEMAGKQGRSISLTRREHPDITLHVSRAIRHAIEGALDGLNALKRELDSYFSGGSSPNDYTAALDLLPAPKPNGRTKEQIDELREWAKTTDRGQLLKHIENAGFQEAQLDRYLDGLEGNYHLRRQVEILYEDSVDHNLIGD